MPASRIFGLDVMRAAAIVLVVFWHSYDAITYLAPGFHVPIFLDGVDLFFVLSGYLIGGILLGMVRKPGFSWRKGLTGFWQRRFFRTLPNYYLFLIINIVLLAMGIGQGLLNHNALAYFAFLQNVWKPLDLYFWESWSLVVEVWFYVLFPVALVLSLRVLRLRTAFAVTVLVFLIAPLLVRLAMAPEVGSVFLGEQSIRKLMITRIDSIVHGVVAALVHARFAVAWRTWRWPLFVVGIAGMLIVPAFYGPEHLHFSLTWYYTFNALSMALLLPLLSSWQNEPRWGWTVTWLSGVSYALFLVHLPVRSLLEPYYDPFNALAGWTQILGYWALCLALAWLVYRIWELPMMNLRERFARR